MVSGAYNLQDFLLRLESWGLTDVMLPFLLIFTIMFAILQKTKILGEEKRRWNAVVSVVIALIAVIPHVLGTYPANADVVEILNKALPSVSVIVVAIVMLLIIIGILGGERNWGASNLSGWVAIAAFLVIIWIFGSAARWWEGWGWFNTFFGADAVAVIIMILVFAIIVWFITKGEGTAKEQTGALNKVQSAFRDFFKPK